jgi:hypothetical protein
MPSQAKPNWFSATLWSLEMSLRFCIFGIAAPLLGLLSSIASAEQSFQTGVTYVCDGERMEIESCNMQNLSDLASCMVAHPDRPLHNGFMAYTNETRGALNKLVPTCKQPSAEKLARHQAFEKKVQEREDALEKQAYGKPAAPVARAAGRPAQSAPVQSTEDQELTRCLESGKSESQCMSNRLVNPVMSMVNTLLPGAAEAQPAGLLAIGAYKGQGNINVSFNENSIRLGGCGNLVPDSYTFTIEMRGNQAVVNVQNNPQPYVITFRPDGALAGPAAVDVKGKVIVGNTRSWNVPQPTDTDYDQFRSGYWRNVPTYQSKTERCTLGIMSPTGSISPDTGNFLGAFGSSKTPQKTLAPGLRLTGEYSGAGGFSVKFDTASALLKCGESADTQDYAVENSGNQTLIKIQNATKPVVLNFKSDRTLIGSGPVQVNGRRLTGKNANGDLTFVPRPATCALGILTPGH